MPQPGDQPLEITPTDGGSVQAILATHLQVFDDHELDRLARQWIDRLGLEFLEAVDGVETWMWIARSGDHSFCISCDDWTWEMTIMPWDGAPHAALADLIRDAGLSR